MTNRSSYNDIILTIIKSFNFDSNIMHDLLEIDWQQMLTDSQSDLNDFKYVLKMTNKYLSNHLCIYADTYVVLINDTHKQWNYLLKDKFEQLLNHLLSTINVHLSDHQIQKMLHQFDYTSNEGILDVHMIQFVHEFNIFPINFTTLNTTYPLYASSTTSKQLLSFNDFRFQLQLFQSISDPHNLY